MPSGELRTHGLPRGPVVPAEDPGVLEECSGRHHRLELAFADEVVVDPVGFAGSRGARRVRHAELDGRLGVGEGAGYRAAARVRHAELDGRLGVGEGAG